MADAISRYHLIEPIGSTEAGIVYRAFDLRLEREVTLEVMFAAGGKRGKLRRRRLDAAHAWSRLSHPHLATIYDVSEERDVAYVAMELPEGPSLADLLAQKAELRVEDRLSTMLQLCSGLDFAHKRGVVHGNVKPGHIFLRQDGGAVIGDFPIDACPQSASDGGSRYVAPEARRGAGEALSDQYSLAVVFRDLEAASARLERHDGAANGAWSIDEPAPEDDPMISAALARILERAASHEPVKRFPDLASMGAELARLLESTARRAYREGRAPIPASAASSLSAWWLSRVSRTDPAAARPRVLAKIGRSDAALAGLAMTAAASLVLAGYAWLREPAAPATVVAAPRTPASKTGAPPPILSATARTSAESSRDVARAARFRSAKAEALDYASDLHEAAQRKEAEADVAFDQSDFANAARLYDAARDAYQMAEARARVESGTLEKSRIDQQLAEEVQSRTAQASAGVTRSSRIRPLIIDTSGSTGAANSREPVVYGSESPRSDDPGGRDSVEEFPPASPPPAPSPRNEIREVRPIYGQAYAVVFTEPSDGNRGGGTWGACWRSDPEAARACARTNCEQRRTTDHPCVEVAASRSGEHCVVARAMGYGVSAGACGEGRSEAEDAAIARCRSEVSSRYGTVTSCNIAWSSAG